MQCERSLERASQKALDLLSSKWRVLHKHTHMYRAAICLEAFRASSLALPFSLLSNRAAVRLPYGEPQNGYLMELLGRVNEKTSCLDASGFGGKEETDWPAQSVLGWREGKPESSWRSEAVAFGWRHAINHRQLAQTPTLRLSGKETLVTKQVSAFVVG